jgi:hypothetical protein
LCCSTCAETITTQNGPASRRLEGYRVGLPTLIAGNLKSLTFATSSFWSTKVGAACVPARLAAFRMSQVAFLIVFLLAFGERKSVSTLRASDLDVWHVTVSISGTEVSPLSLFGAQANHRSVSNGC